MRFINPSFTAKDRSRSMDEDDSDDKKKPGVVKRSTSDLTSAKAKKDNSQEKSSTYVPQVPTSEFLLPDSKLKQDAQTTEEKKPAIYVPKSTVVPHLPATFAPPTKNRAGLAKEPSALSRLSGHSKGSSSLPTTSEHESIPQASGHSTVSNASAQKAISKATGQGGLSRTSWHGGVSNSSGQAGTTQLGTVPKSSWHGTASKTSGPSVLSSSSYHGGISGNSITENATYEATKPVGTTPRAPFKKFQPQCISTFLVTGDESGPKASSDSKRFGASAIGESPTAGTSGSKNEGVSILESSKQQTPPRYTPPKKAVESAASNPSEVSLSTTPRKYNQQATSAPQAAGGSVLSKWFPVAPASSSPSAKALTNDLMCASAVEAKTQKYPPPSATNPVTPDSLSPPKKASASAGFNLSASAHCSSPSESVSSVPEKAPRKSLPQTSATPHTPDNFLASKKSNVTRAFGPSAATRTTPLKQLKSFGEDDEPPEGSRHSAAAIIRKTSSIDSTSADQDGDVPYFLLFDEATSIEYNPELDHIAVEVYKGGNGHDEEEAPKAPRPPGISGYGFDVILAEEMEEPEDPNEGGMYGSYMAKRRKQLKWEAHLRMKGKKATTIQALIRRFLGRVVFWERVRLRELERKRQRVSDIDKLILDMEVSKKKAIADLQSDYDKKRATAMDSLFDFLKAEGRKNMEETRRMVSSMPALYKEAKELKAQEQDINLQIRRLTTHVKKTSEASKRLELVASKFNMLVCREAGVLQAKDQLCAIESTMREIFEDGLKRLVLRVEGAASGDFELVESVKAVYLDCEATDTPQMLNYVIPWHLSL